MREEDDVERSAGRDREKSSEHAGSKGGERPVEERHVGGTPRGSRSARARRMGRKRARRSAETGYVGRGWEERESGGRGWATLREGVR